MAKKIKNGLLLFGVDEIQQYKLLVDTANEGIFTINSDDEIIFCNDRLCEMLGYHKDEIIGRKRMSFVWDEDKVNIESKTFQRKRGIKETYECRLKTRHKEYIWCLISASPIFDDNGNFVGSFGMVNDISKSKISEQAFIESDRRFRLLTENSSDIITIQSSKGIFKYVSPAVTRVLGYRPEELTGKNFNEYLHPDDLPRIRQTYTIVFSKPINITISFRIRRSDGVYVWCESSSRIIYDEDNKDHEIQSSTRDITARKQIELKLNESLNSIFAVLENTKDMIWTVSSDNYKIKSFNTAFREHLLSAYGVELEQGMGVDEVFPQNKTEKWNSFYSSAVKNGPLTIEYELDNKDVFEFAFHTIVGQMNKIDILIFGRNITERLNAKKELQKSEQKYRLLFENMTSGFCLFEVLCDNNNKPFDALFIEINPAFSSIFSVGQNNVLGKTLNEFNTELHKKLINKLCEVSLSGVSAFFVEYFASLNKHFDVWIFRNMELNVAVIFTDITKRKIIEREFEDYRTHLEDLVKERTQKIEEVNRLLQKEIEKEKAAEGKVLEALAKEKELNELKTRFISMASHEFRTPLTAILSSADLLELYGRKWSDEKNLKHTSQIRRSVKYMTELLDDVLTIGRVESGTTVFSPSRVMLYELCSDIMESIKLKATDKHDFKFNFMLEKGEYLLDEKLIRQILVNILSNSVKYSPDGGKIIFEILSGNDKIYFTVEDEGIGIPKGELDNLSVPFYRGRNVSNIPGTGLGMSIVRNSVDLHKGEIKIESEINKGTKVTISIPLTK